MGTATNSNLVSELAGYRKAPARFCPTFVPKKSGAGPDNMR